MIVDVRGSWHLKKSKLRRRNKKWLSFAKNWFQHLYLWVRKRKIKLFQDWIRFSFICLLFRTLFFLFTCFQITRIWQKQTDYGALEQLSTQNKVQIRMKYIFNQVKPTISVTSIVCKNFIISLCSITIKQYSIFSLKLLISIYFVLEKNNNWIT